MYKENVFSLIFQQPMMQGRPMGPQGGQQGPQGMPRFPNQNQWNPRQNGPRPMPNGPPGPPQRPMVKHRMICINAYRYIKLHNFVLIFGKISYSFNQVVCHEVQEVIGIALLEICIKVSKVRYFCLSI